MSSRPGGRASSALGVPLLRVLLSKATAPLWASAQAYRV
jgi:hypothetical protein